MQKSADLIITNIKDFNLHNGNCAK